MMEEQRIAIGSKLQLAITATVVKDMGESWVVKLELGKELQLFPQEIQLLVAKTKENA